MNCNKIVEYKDLLNECFETDTDLLQKWHIESGNGLEQCVERTYKDLKSANVAIFKLDYNNDLAGYFGIEGGNFLSGFFLKPEFRKKPFVELFWSEVDKQFKDPIYYAGLYKKNTPAINFLSKRGKVYLEFDDFVVMMIIKESTCR